IKFKELGRSTKGRSNLTRLGIDASYTINSKGQGRLMFTTGGMAKLDKIFGEDKSKPFKLFIDEETQSLGFLLTEKGKYKLTGLASYRNLLTCHDLTEAFRQEMFYKMVESQNYSFILVPIHIAKNEPKTHPLTIDKEKVEESPKLTDNASPAKKAKGKKK
ncbi:MAG: hypothetical protein WAQ98_06240, partial [Blastocatellia bacterium]